LYFWFDPKDSASWRTRLDKNSSFSTDRIPHAIQAAPPHNPKHASVLLTNTQSWNSSIENLRNFYQANPKPMSVRILISSLIEAVFQGYLIEVTMAILVIGERIRNREAISYPLPHQTAQSCHFD